MTIREQDTEQLFKILEDTIDSDDTRSAALTALAIVKVVVKLLTSIADSLETLAKISERQDDLRREDLDP